MNVQSLPAILIAACLLSYGMVNLVHRWAVQRNIVDIPNERSSHSIPTPRGGGLAISSVTVVMFTIVMLFTLEQNRRSNFAYLIAATIIFVTGGIDDAYSITAPVRLVIQLAASAIMLCFVGPFTTIEIPVLGTLNCGVVIGTVLTLIWLVGFTNMFNFMDGIDGIAGTQAFVAGVSWLILLLMLGQASLALLAGLIAATSMGFLFLNLPPARIFMGDVGSTFLGFSLAAIPVLAYQATANPRLPVVGVIFVLPFVFDASFTIVRRALKRENMFQAHRTHLYQRLTKVGYTHSHITGLYSALAVISALCGIAYFVGSEAVITAALLLTIAIHSCMAVIVTRTNIGREKKTITARPSN